MVPNQYFTRIDTLQLKVLIVKKIGHLKAEKYFCQLTRFFTSKLNKSEFGKFCIQTLGKENIPLHNRLIGAIVKNAHIAKVPPSNGRSLRGSLSVRNTDGYQKNSLQSLYGDAFPLSPRKGRSLVNRDRKFRDRPSPLGPLGKSQSVTCEELVRKAQEQQSATELLSIGSRPPVEVASVEDGEEVDQAAGSPDVQSKSPVTAPLGISNNLCGARKALYNGSVCNYRHDTCHNNGELPDTRSLRSRLERKLEMEGINVSVDCANLLNNGLDAFLKGLIEPSTGLATSRCGSGHFQQLNGRIILDSNATLSARYIHRSNRPVNASLSDFRASMEINPQILGDDWAVQLERISFRAWED